jgi:hypothetical protein
MKAKGTTGLALLLLLTACGSDAPTTEPVPVPSLAGTFSSTVWLTQFNRTHDGYSGSWSCSGSMTLAQEPGSSSFTGFAVVGAPCPGVSFELAGTVTPGGAITMLTRGPRPGAGTCPLPPPSTYTGTITGNTPVRAHDRDRRLPRPRRGRVHVQPDRHRASVLNIRRDA